MTDDDFDGFAQAWNGAWELTGKTPTPNAVLLAFHALRGYELEEITRALTRHALNPDTGQFAPKPADVVRAIEGGGDGRAAQAWTKVVDAVRLVGGYSSVTFDDPIAQAVIADMGGWAELCDTLMDRAAENSNFPFVERDFERRYRAYLQTGRQKYPAVLLGRFDLANLPQGYQRSAPFLIGDQAKAQAVLSGGTENQRLTFTEAKPLRALLAQANE